MRCLAFSSPQGFNVVYTELYNRALRKNRTLMTAFFVALQPPIYVLALVGAAAIRASPLAALAPAVCGTAAGAQALALTGLTVAFVPKLLQLKAVPTDWEAHAAKAHAE